MSLRGSLHATQGSMQKEYVQKLLPWYNLVLPMYTLTMLVCHSLCHDRNSQGGILRLLRVHSES